LRLLAKCLGNLGPLSKESRGNGNYPLRDPFAGRRIRWSEHTKPSVNREALGQAGALVVAEPTGIKPLVGHKGALWLEAESKGVTAHGLTAEKGVSAIYKAARAATAL
jgi:hypothetical protein